MKPLDEMEDLLEVILKEEDNQEVEQLPQLLNFQYLPLLMFGQWEPYLKSLVETGPKLSTLWMKCWDISKPTQELQVSTPQYEELPSLSHLSKGTKPLNRHATWEGGSTDSTQSMTKSPWFGSSSNMSSKDD